MQILPRTKFWPPQPHAEVILRAKLIDWVKKELPDSRLLLLSAPAGYGKTTLLCSLPEIMPDYRLAWFALDAEDNDLIRFLSGLGEAFSRIYPSLKEVIENQVSANAGLISGGNVFPLHQTLSLLINGILSLPVEPCILVLDDLHEIDNPAVLTALDYLIDKQPATLHLAISTRTDPSLRLTHLRARRQLAELNAADLSFNQEESQRFLNGLLHLGLSAADLDALQQKTEGWPVGLVLLTGELRGLPAQRDRSDFLRQLTPIDAHTFNYLADEVLARQPEPYRSFLLETSILAELTPSLCQAVTGRDDAENLLTELYRRNLFLSSVSGAGKPGEPVFRYHALFADFLRQALAQKNVERWRSLHLLAARAETVPGRAIGHLLSAQEWEAACEQIEQVGELYIQQGLQETVSSWIKALPVELARSRFYLQYLDGFTGLLKGDLLEAHGSLEQALSLLEAEKDTAIRGRLLVGLASLAFIRADFTLAANLVNQAEPYAQEVQERIDLLMLRASLSLFWESNWARAEQDLRDAIHLVHQSDDPRLWFLFSLYLGPEFTVLPGVIDLLETFCETAWSQVGEQVNPLRLCIEDTWACIHLRRGRLMQAVQTGKAALQVKATLGGYPFLGVNASLAVASAYFGLGNFLAANEYLSRSAGLAAESELNRALTGGGLYPMGKLLWLEGRYDEARQVYQQMASLKIRLPMLEVLQNLLGGLLEISANLFRQAELLLAEAVRLQSKELISEVYGSARLLLAYLYLRWEKPQEALDQIERVLAVCERNHIPGMILQDTPLAAPLLRLAVKSGRRAKQSAGLLEQMGLPLEEEQNKPDLVTVRQLEILRLMEAGYSNQAIADALVLSLATVKSHIVHIMNRLDASSRMEAVALARQAGLL